MKDLPMDELSQRISILLQQWFPSEGIWYFEDVTDLVRDLLSRPALGFWVALLDAPGIQPTGLLVSFHEDDHIEINAAILKQSLEHSSLHAMLSLSALLDDLIERRGRILAPEELGIGVKGAARPTPLTHMTCRTPSCSKTDSWRHEQMRRSPQMVRVRHCPYCTCTLHIHTWHARRHSKTQCLEPFLLDERNVRFIRRRQRR